MDIDYGEIEPLQQMTERTCKFPVNINAQTVNDAQIDYAYALTGASDEELIGLSIICSILNQESSSFTKAFSQAQIGGRASVSLDDTRKQPVLIFTAENADENKSHEFMSLVDNCVNELITDGYDKELADAMI